MYFDGAMKKTLFYLATLWALALGVSARSAMNPFSAPSVTLLSPLDGTTHAAPSELTLLALADHANAQVQAIEFFANETRLGRMARNTLGLIRFDFVRFVWSNPPPGTHRLVARLMGEGGELAVSRPVTVTIQSNAAVTDARIVITSPRDGEVFRSSEPLSVYAVYQDPKGYINRVEFYADEQQIGVSEILFIKAPPDGEPIFHSIEWKNPRVGEIKLWARSRTSRGVEVVSAPVKIRVVASQSFVERRLPAAYSPGDPFEVALDARPTAATTVYGVEDQIPEGWTAIVPAGQDGDFDKTNRKVKFGPYFDSKTRVLRYVVTPPPGSRGEKRFVGSAAADGVVSSIAGASSIDSAMAHPADYPEPDFVLSLGEVTAYGLAWRKGRRWPVDPNPIPMDYVTRASALWRGGEKYYFDAAAGRAPGWWVSALPRNTQSLHFHGMMSNDRVHASMVGDSRIQRLVEPHGMGQPANVILRVNPDPATQAHAVEERIPVEMMVSGISHEGVFDPATGSLRWGPFFDHEARALGYQVDGSPVQPLVMRIAGSGSFDGVSVPISQEHRSDSMRPSVRLIRTGEGGVEVLGEGDVGKTYVLESTGDFIHWFELRRLTSAETTFQFRCEENGDMQRFYRIRQVSTDE